MTIMYRLALLAGIAAAMFATAIAGHAHADPQCKYLGQNYPVPYVCDQYQPQLPYGTYDNPPISGPNLGTDCSKSWNQQNQGCL